MAEKKTEPVLPTIHALRKQKVVLDADLAALQNLKSVSLRGIVEAAAFFPF